MADPNEITTETIVIRTPGGADIRWRTQRMTSLGANDELALEIANSTADVHEIERLLKAGCALELAWTIVRPVSEPPAVVGQTSDDA